MQKINDFRKEPKVLTVQCVCSTSGGVVKNGKKQRFYFELNIDVNKCDSWT